MPVEVLPNFMMDESRYVFAPFTISSIIDLEQVMFAGKRWFQKIWMPLVKPSVMEPIRAYQSEYRKMRTRNNFEFDTFHAA